MKVGITGNGKARRITVNRQTPVIEYSFKGVERRGGREIGTSCGKVAISEEEWGLALRKELDTYEHVIGFGEKAFDIERRRLVLRMWNTDPGGYRRGDDPIYTSIPFFISVRERVAGYFVNSTSEVVFDVGVSEYDQVLVKIPEKHAEIYLFEGSTIEEVVEQFVGLTGMPFMPPEWSLGHQISRYSYYPENSVLKVAGEYAKLVPVSAIYLDIDYMDGFKLFTWNSKIFRDPKGMVESLHRKGIRAVAIMDPGLKAEQGYRHFEKGVGGYVETGHRELYLGRVWPGLCAFPDFFRDEAVEHWKGMVKSFVTENSLDGLWLDMNEPSVFSETKTIPEDAVHSYRGERVKHGTVHNAYGFMEVRATYEAMKEVVEEPFILSRSGYAGIQKYAAIWTGDNISSWDDLRLQIPMVTSMGISGIPFAGCDLGGFAGRTEGELLARYYQMALFFPVFRNHKAKDGSDQELYLLPERFRKLAADAVSTRYMFMPYLYSLAYEAHRTGHPVARPLCYEFQNDRTAYSINDEYMAGRSLLYAPLLEKGERGRDVYLPEGSWFSLYEGVELTGPGWFSRGEGDSIFIRRGSVIPMSGNAYLAYGSGEFHMFDGKERLLKSDATGFDAGHTVEEGEVTFLGIDGGKCSMDGKMTGCLSENGRTRVAGRGFRRVSVLSRAGSKQRDSNYRAVE